MEAVRRTVPDHEARPMFHTAEAGRITGDLGLSRVPACPGGGRQPRRQPQKAVVSMENHPPPEALHDRDRLPVTDSGISVTIPPVVKSQQVKGSLTWEYMIVLSS